MKFTFKIFQSKNGRPELFLEPPPLDLGSIDTAHRLAKHFAGYVPVNLITIEAEDGSVSELRFGTDMGARLNRSRRTGDKITGIQSWVSPRGAFGGHVATPGVATDLSKS